ncbi:hypothetical protein EPR50_G00000460 [Perca flavescens]|uniref:Uncharacterized protein n=1 Tax=Perca flavescens TaxID=8167 RepID=A0A484DNT5_PERFV|nr:hypothetical protein EPR50_G00000460 [Perca flavescens]
MKKKLQTPSTSPLTATMRSCLKETRWLPEPENPLCAGSQNRLWRKASNSLVRILFTMSEQEKLHQRREQSRMFLRTGQSGRQTGALSQRAGLPLLRHHHPARGQPRSGLPARTHQERPRQLLYIRINWKNIDP